MINDFSIIIVNFNTYPDLTKCISSILNLDIKLNYKIVVVDNNSDERNIEKINIDFPEVILISSMENKGFGSACNKGANVTESKYLVFVNPDTIFFEDSFTPLFEYMEKNINTGVCSAILENEKKNLVYTFNNFPGLRWEIMEAFGIGSHKRILRLLKNPVILNRSTLPMKVDWVVGAFMFFRADVFISLNGFDEDYFLYYEDVDIQKRVGLLNLKVEILPNIRICHNERSSVRNFKGENLYYFHMMRSKLIYFYKNSNIIKRYLIRFLHITGITLRFIYLPFRSKFKGKKQQKYFQYKMIFNLLFLNYYQLLSKDLPASIYVKIPDKSNEIIKDEFWS